LKLPRFYLLVFYDKNSIEMNTSKDCWWNDTDGNTGVFGETPVPLPLHKKSYVGRPRINPLKMKRICYISGCSAYHAVNTLRFSYKNQSLKAEVAVCSEIRTKHINAMWAPRRIF
jgi:hypothetical protein